MTGPQGALRVEIDEVFHMFGPLPENIQDIPRPIFQKSSLLFMNVS